MGGQVSFARIAQDGGKCVIGNGLQRFAEARSVVAIVDDQRAAALVRDHARDFFCECQRCRRNFIDSAFRRVCAI